MFRLPSKIALLHQRDGGDFHHTPHDIQKHRLNNADDEQQNRAVQQLLHEWNIFGQVTSRLWRRRRACICITHSPLSFID